MEKDFLDDIFDPGEWAFWVFWLTIPLHFWITIPAGLIWWGIDALG